MEIKNAKVVSVSLSNADHGILSAWLHLDYGGSGQGFGGYALHGPHAKRDGKPAPYDCTGKWVWRCLDICGVSAWEKIPGSVVRVKFSDDGQRLIGIGHALKDDWFYPDTELTEAK